MFRNLSEKINRLFPYKTNGENNRIYVVENGVKKLLKRKIEGLEIEIIGRDNYIEIEMPIAFSKSKIRIRGNKAKFTIKQSSTKVIGVLFDMESYSEIFIDEDSRLNMEKGTLLVGNNAKNKPHRLIIGKGVQVGTEVYIRTSDGHSIFNEGEDLPYNEPQDIIIGDDVWIGARCTILKGVEIPAHSIIGACSVVNKKFTEENTIIAGHPAKVVKRRVSWKRSSYGSYLNEINGETYYRRLPSSKSIMIKKLKRKINKMFKSRVIL